MTKAERLLVNARHILINCRAYPPALVMIAWNYLQKLKGQTQ